MSFINQSKIAKAKTVAYRKNYEWKTAAGKPGYALGTSFSDYQLRKGFDQAYASKEGYAIIKNPITKENEMFVRGTANKKEWVQNAIESVPTEAYGLVPVVGAAANVSFRQRGKYAKKLDGVAKANGVKTVYGHSRGGAVVADMKAPVKKVGVDGAMLLAKRGTRNFKNYRESQWFDYIISRGERASQVKRRSWNPRRKSFHKVYYNGR